MKTQLKVLSLVLCSVAFSGFARANTAPITQVETAVSNTFNSLYKVYNYQTSGDPELDFVSSMIKHHEATVILSEDILGSLSDPFIKAVADTIIRTRSDYIKTLSAWLSKQDLDVRPSEEEIAVSVDMLDTTKQIIDYQRQIKQINDPDFDYVELITYQLETEITQADLVSSYLTDNEIEIYKEKLRLGKKMLEKLQEWKSSHKAIAK
ncbi:DUF305 domain-containing protein [Vibrio vulnificus]